MIYSNFKNITKNVINNNGIYGIYLLESNYNYITENTLIGNKEKPIHEENCVGNIIEDNYTGGVKSRFPFELVILLSIIGAVAIVVSAGIIVYKKKVAPPKKEKKVGLKAKREEIKEKEKLRLEKQKKKRENKLQKLMKFVDYLIKERNLKKAPKKVN